MQGPPIRVGLSVETTNGRERDWRRVSKAVRATDLTETRRMGFLKWIAKRGTTGGIVRSQAAKYRRLRRRFPDATDQDILREMFQDRFRTLSPTSSERARLEAFERDGRPINTMHDLCLSIFEIETGIAPRDFAAHMTALEVIDEECQRLGFSDTQGGLSEH